MKKYRIFAFVLALALLLTGCKGLLPDNTEPPATTESKQKPNVLYAWTGEFSEEKLQKAIEEYRENYTPFVSGETAGISQAFFETDFDVAEFTVSRLSKVDDSDINIEMKSYIDQYIQKEYDGRKITVATDWWHKSTGWTKEIPVWSYLIRVEDTAGTDHYYYFRVRYIAATDSTES